ncbi:MAG: serpin family protein [Oscillospiraceae bacterium]|nr:serpin family protein [Oscillospiraceae bacterium]
MKQKKLISLTALLLVVLLSLQLAGCASLAPSVQAANLMENVTSNRGAALPVQAEDAAAAADFALRLFKAGNESDRNTLISPLSVLTALAMTANGARGETLAQMEQTLGMDQARLNTFVRSYLDTLPADGSLKLANSIWFKLTPPQEFLQTIADYYDADIYKAPFDDSTLEDLNNWVKTKTDGMIPKILDRIPPDARMYLVNALAFDAKWESPYEPSDLFDGIFTLENGETREVKYMGSAEVCYLENEHATGFLKCYKGGKYAFAALLPKEGGRLKDYVDSLTGAELQSLLAERSMEAVDVSLPKFKTEYDTELSDVMKSMGMELPFADAADFSGMGGDLAISRILHKTFLSVDEQGTKAAAATVVEMAGCAEIMENKRVDLNRPFVYLLIDTETNLPFFIGTMVDPAA